MSIKISRCPICRHTLTNGRRCKSPALAASAFCYHHRKLRLARHTTSAQRPALLDCSPNALRDYASIQRALGQVYQGVASGRLPVRPAGQMLHLLQLALTQHKTLAESGIYP